jgi:hypothetical protein
MKQVPVTPSHSCGKDFHEKWFALKLVILRTTTILLFIFNCGKWGQYVSSWCVVYALTETNKVEM